MNDEVRLPPVQTPPSSGRAAPELAKVVSLPPGLPPNKVISGEVVSNDKGVVTIKTDQGLVTVETAIDAKAGQKISLRLQVVMQQTKQAMIAELLTVGADKTAAPHVQNPVASDQVQVNTGKALAEFTPLQARMVSLPDVLGDEAVQTVLKTLLKLPPVSDLPQTLKEGLAKFRQLTALMGQANLLPAQSLQSGGGTPSLQNGLLTALQQLFQQGGQAQKNLLSGPGQSFIQLQTILPGQNISPDILLNVRQQLMAILQPQSGQTQANPLYTMPAIGLVLGQSSGAAGGNLVFMATPQGQQLVGLLSSAPQIDAGKALPGTVIVVAFEPQTQQMVTLPVMPSAMMEDALSPLRPLNLSLGDTWPALKEIVEQALAQQAAQPELMQALRQILPTPTPQQMPAALLFFMAVLKQGMPDQWLGEAPLKALEKLGKGDLLKQLGSDMRLLQASLNDNAPVDSWRPLPVPLQVGEQLMRLQFFYRHPEDGRQDDDDDRVRKQRKTRFLLNVPKTSYGEVQIDGLVQDKDLEMILRTESTLTSQIEGAIRERYQRVLETTGMHGGIDFQSGHQHFVRV